MVIDSVGTSGLGVLRCFDGLLSHHVGHAIAVLLLLAPVTVTVQAQPSTDYGNASAISSGVVAPPPPPVATRMYCMPSCR